MRTCGFCGILFFVVIFSVGVALAATPQEQANGELELIAKDIASLCNHPGFLGFLRSEIVQSKNREQIIELDRLLDRAAKQQTMPPNLAATAEKVKATKARHKAMNITRLEGFDLYIPVKAHRAKWKGGKDFIVAVSPYGDDMAFQTTVGYSVADGRRVVLDAKQPPETVVMVIAPEEHADHNMPTPEPDVPSRKAPHEDKPKPDAGKSEKQNSVFSMSYIKIHQTGESWLRGDPEIYLLAGQICNGVSKAYRFNLPRVNSKGVWYYVGDLNQMYFDATCSWDTFYAVWEDDDGYNCGGVFAYTNCGQPVTPALNCYPDSKCSFMYVYSLWRGNGDDPVHTYIPQVHTNKMLGNWGTHNYDSYYSDTRNAEAKFYKTH